jgi:hypothetical protein
MNKESKIALGIFVAQVIVAQGLENRKLRIRCNELLEIARGLDKEVEYLVHILNENDVELDEFDLIVLPHVNRREDS